MFARFLSSRHRAAIALIAAATLLQVPSAQAGPLVADATDCDEAVYETPFVPWADYANYVLVPNGIVTNTRQWTLAGGASSVSGNETFYVHGDNEKTSLSLPAGSSATTAPICVGLENPTLRFFARTSGSLLSSLKVEVLYEDASGQIQTLAIGNILAGPDWQPTPALAVVANLLPLLPESRTAVAFKFTPYGAGTWSIDDVYVDPWRHR